MNAEQGSRALKVLAAKAARPDVEHILDVAVEGTSSDAPLLTELKRVHRWPDQDLRKDGPPRQIPLGRWADTVVAFLEGGIGRMASMAVAEDDDLASFPLAVLEALGTLEAVQGVLTVGSGALASQPVRRELALKCSSSMNLLVGVPNSIEVSESLAGKAREFLHPLLDWKLPTHQLAGVCCALRGVGNEESIALMKQFPPFPAPYDGLHKLVGAAIRKRLR